VFSFLVPFCSFLVFFPVFLPVLPHIYKITMACSPTVPFYFAFRRSRSNKYHFSPSPGTPRLKSSGMPSQLTGIRGGNSFGISLCSRMALCTKLQSGHYTEVVYPLKGSRSLRTGSVSMASKGRVLLEPA